MPYKLKPNAPDFEMVDGPFKGRQFKPGEVYDEIPETETNKFDKIGAEAAALPKESVAPEAPVSDADTDKGGKKK